MSNQKSYPGDMTDAQAELLLSLIPPAKPGGCPRTVDIRTVVNAIFYVLCTGCPWAWLPGASHFCNEHKYLVEK